MWDPKVHPPLLIFRTKASPKNIYAGPVTRSRRRTGVSLTESFP